MGGLLVRYTEIVDGRLTKSAGHQACIPGVLRRSTIFEWLPAAYIYSS